MKFNPKVPASLLDLQKWMGGMIIRPLREMGNFRIPKYDVTTDREIALRIAPGPKLTASERLGIYNQQYWFRLFALLQRHFPTLVRFFGYRAFNRRIAEPYLLKYFPDHWSLAPLGYRLPHWIAQSYRQKNRTFILQMAQLDEAHERFSYIGALPLFSLQGAAKGRLFLQPFVIPWQGSTDLFSFREKLLEEPPKFWAKADLPPLHTSKESFFVLFRDEGEFTCEEISEEEYLLLKTFEKGATLAKACSCVGEKVASQISGWFRKWGRRGWFTSEAFLLAEELQMSQPKSEVSSSRDKSPFPLQ